MNILVTGGAGFIGSAVCRHLAANPGHRVVNVDKLTYAGNLASLRQIENYPNYRFVKADICDAAAMSRHSSRTRRSTSSCISPPKAMSTARSTARPLSSKPTSSARSACLPRRSPIGAAFRRDRRSAFRFHHVSTDEVFGDLPFDSGIFTEETPYAPSSPYSASKAASDHLVRAWHETYGLPVVLSNCSNNYGPFHFPEKLIPLVILNALEEKPLPVYGNGANVRDWLFVEDHARALELVATKGKAGRKLQCRRAQRAHQSQRRRDDLRHSRPAEATASGGSYRDLITFVTDRPGHDRRYAIDASKIERELGWTPSETFESGLARTVRWYLDNEWWWEPIRSGRYAGERLGAPGQAAS